MELERYFSRFNGYRTFTKRFKGVRFLNWRQEQAYIDKESDEGVKRRKEFDAGFARAKKRAGARDHSEELEHYRSDVMNEIRRSDGRRLAIEGLCSSDEDPKNGPNIEMTDVKAACIHILETCDDWQARPGGMGEDCPDRRDEDKRTSLSGNPRRELEEARRDKSLRNREKFFKNNPNHDVRGVSDFGVIQAGDDTDAVRAKEARCLEYARRRKQQRESALGAKIFPAYEPPVGCSVIKNFEGHISECQCES